MKSLFVIFISLALFSSAFTQINGLPRFKKYESYKSFRLKMLKAGWKPVHFKDADDCSGLEWCKAWPEMRNWQGASPGYITFMWSRSGKMVVVTTLDDPPYVDNIAKYHQ